MIRVFVAEHRTIVRRGIREILADSRQAEVHGEAATVADLRVLVATQACDVVLLNLRITGARGLSSLADVRALRPSLPVIAYSNHPDDDFERDAIEMGASGWFPKAPSPVELVATIRDAANAGRPAGAAAREGGAAPHAALSDREFEVLRQYAAGRTAVQIGAQLTISPKTVSTYRARILEKLGLRTTAEIVRYAMRHRLVD